MNGRSNLPDVSWFNADGQPVVWTKVDSMITCLLSAPPESEDPQKLGRDVLTITNAGNDTRTVMLPHFLRSDRWRKFIDTRHLSPNDIFPQLDGPRLPKNRRVKLIAKSMVVYVSC